MFLGQLGIASGQAVIALGGFTRHDMISLVGFGAVGWNLATADVGTII
jgi:hypothetical protein